MQIHKKNNNYKIEVIGQLVIKKPPNKSNLPVCNELQELKNTNAYLDDFKYADLVQECFTYAIEGKFKSLSLKRNYKHQIIKEISHIKFSYLRVLQLNTNSIGNIQALGWLNALNLRCLDLEQNLICSLKPLAKFYTNSFSQLKIGTNLFFETYNLTRMKFRTNQFTRDLSIHDISDARPYNKKTHFSLQFLAKIQQPEELHEQWIMIKKVGLLNPRHFHQSIKRKNTKTRALQLSIITQTLQFMRVRRLPQVFDNFIDLQ